MQTRADGEQPRHRRIPGTRRSESRADAGPLSARARGACSQRTGVVNNGLCGDSQDTRRRDHLNQCGFKYQQRGDDNRAMNTAADFWRSVGETFVDRTPELSLALAEHATTGRPLIDILVVRGLVSAHDLEAALFTFDQEEEEEEEEEDPGTVPAARTVVPLDEAREGHALRRGHANSSQLDPARDKDRAQSLQEDSIQRYSDTRVCSASSSHFPLDGLLDRVGAATDRLEETRARLHALDQREQETLARWQAARSEIAEPDGELAALLAQLEEKKQKWAEAREVARSELGRAAKLEAEAAVLVSDVGQSARALADLIASHPELPPGARRDRHTEPDPSPDAAPASEEGVVYLVPRVGTWALIERSAPVPTPGDVVALDDHQFVVTRITRSPLPFDRRPCVILGNR
jgi:hypothetical protein